MVVVRMLAMFVVVRSGCTWRVLGVVMVGCRLVGKLQEEGGCFGGGRILGEGRERVAVGRCRMACLETGFCVGKTEGRTLERCPEAGR